MLRLPLSPLWPGRTVSGRGAPCRRCPADSAPPAPRPPDQLRPASSPARRPAGPREEVEGGPPGQRVSPLPPPPRGERRPQSPGRAPRHGLPRPPQEPLEAAALAAALRSRLFFQAPQERFVRSMADWLPGKADGLAPSTMALIAKYLARHRLREPPLLDCIAAFLLARLELLDSKVIQRLVFPFSRVNYRPSNHAQLFPRLESVLTQKASPLPAVNVLMSLFQLQHFPLSLLRKVFSPTFLINVASSPCGWIMRRYLSLLDAAVTLEVHEYDGPRLDPRYRVQMFDGALTADEANCKYSFKGLVAEALRQLLGEGRFRQDEVLPPGYCTDFLLWISPSGAVLPLNHVPRFSKTAAAARTGARLERVQTVSSDMQNLSPFRLELLGSPTAGSVLSKGASPPPLPPPDCYCSLSKEPSSSSPSSSTPTSSLPDLLGSCVPGNAICVSCPTWNAVHEDSQLLPAGPPTSTRRSSSEGAVRGGPQKAEQFQRVVLSVNDKWHYCQNTDILVGSRAMRDRHLRLLGYRLVQLPYTELEKVSGVEEAKHYLGQKLTELRS